MTLRWTILLSALAVLASTCEPLPALLEFDRTEVGARWWCVLTGHFTHWSASHLFWDVVVFAALAAILERRGRARMLGCVAVSAFAITAAIAVLQPEIVTYRGLSGIDSALFVLVIGILIGEARRNRNHLRLSVLAVAIAGFLGKILVEAVTGNTLFAESQDFIPLPLAHGVGAAVGVCFALIGGSGARRVAGRTRRDPRGPASSAVGGCAPTSSCRPSR